MSIVLIDPEWWWEEGEKTINSEKSLHSIPDFRFKRLHQIYCSEKVNSAKIINSGHVFVCVCVSTRRRKNTIRLIDWLITIIDSIQFESVWPTVAGYGEPIVPCHGVRLTRIKLHACVVIWKVWMAIAKWIEHRFCERKLNTIRSCCVWPKYKAIRIDGLIDWLVV